MKQIILSNYQRFLITWEQAESLLRKGGHTIEANLIYHINN